MHYQSSNKGLVLRRRRRRQRRGLMDVDHHGLVVGHLLHNELELGSRRGSGGSLDLFDRRFFGLLCGRRLGIVPRGRSGLEIAAEADGDDLDELGPEAFVEIPVEDGVDAGAGHPNQVTTDEQADHQLAVTLRKKRKRWK